MNKPVYLYKSAQGFIISFIFFNVLIAQTFALKRHTVNLDFGYNYYGNTMAISFKHRLSNSWSAGIGFSRGLFDYVHKAHTSMFGIMYEGDYDLSVALHLEHLIDFFVCYNKNTKKNLNFFDEFGYGLTHYYIKLEESMVESETGWEYRGAKYFTNAALLIFANVIEVRPKNSNTISFSAGVKLYGAILDSHQKVILYYEDIPWPLEWMHSLGFMLFVYPQAYFKIGVSF